MIDLVVRAPDGLHVIDLKTHPLKRDDLARWAAYYRPQLDAYGLAVERLTGERVAGRHLAVPAAGELVTLPGVFNAGHVAATLERLAGELARGMRGPSQDCAHCGWKDLCRVGKVALRNASAEVEDG